MSWWDYETCVIHDLAFIYGDVCPKCKEEAMDDRPMILPEGTSAQYQKNPIIKELEDLLKQIDMQIVEVEREAKTQMISPHMLKHTDGSWALTPLLTAKADVLTTLANVPPPMLILQKEVPKKGSLFWRNR